MLACPTRGVGEVLQKFESTKFTCEWKYDGERAQIHLLENGEIRIYSRNQENNTSKYPDIISRFQSWIEPSASVRSAILDTEAVAWDTDKKQILPFQILSTRKRKDAVEADIKVQVKYFDMFNKSNHFPTFSFIHI
jgi:DNA ligase-1